MIAVSSAPLDKFYDVAVLGAGPAGSALAIRLRQLGTERVLLAESSHFERERIGETVPPDIRGLLDKLGVLEAFLNENQQRSLGSCSSWGSGELGFNDFVVNLYGNGWHLNRVKFDALLAQQAHRASAHLRLGLRFIAGEAERGRGYQLVFRDSAGNSHSTTARVVVDASGKSARFARQMAARRQYDDKLVCVASTFALHPEAQLSKLTVLESCPYGWWYAARLAENRAVIAVASDAEFIRKYALDRRQSWLWHLSGTHHIAPQLGRSAFLPKHFKVLHCPSFCLDHVQGDDWVAIGDAAMSFDPILAQGIYKAVWSGILAAEQIQDGKSGSTRTLSSYGSIAKHQYAEYLKMRNYLYSQEQRWSNHPFWKLRHKATSSS